MTDLELLAPARNADIGIAAIDCGADAVYMAGPAFGARKAAGNGIAEISRLADYAHKYGARVFITVNTIIYDEELPRVRELLRDVAEAGADAVIVQDMAVARMARELGLGIALHASTQCAIRTPQRARFLSSAGFSRIILEREMSLEQIRNIRREVDCELEFFVHGALCVCYSGNCYLSEHINARSANRGECIQACRSRYDLVDSTGKTILKNKAVLSMKDYNLIGRLSDLADAGISSFKIEGRLKNESYVRNVVRAYSEALDALVRANADKYRRASFGYVTDSFQPELSKTFNRGYTELFIDGKRDSWAAMDAAKGMGEEIGRVQSLSADLSVVTVKAIRPGIELHNADGFSFVAGNGEVVGFRGDRCEGMRIFCKSEPKLFVGARLFRNLDAAFEKQLAAKASRRLIRVEISATASGNSLQLRAVSEDGREVVVNCGKCEGAAQRKERMAAMIESQLSKSSDIFSFHLRSIQDNGELPFMSAGELNAMRRELASALASVPVLARKMKTAFPEKLECEDKLSYKENVSNSLAREFFVMAGAETIENAYELGHRDDAELMRTKYCVRYELGLCPKQKQTGNVAPGPLYLLNNGRCLELGFDCRNCEMTVKKA